MSVKKMMIIIFLINLIVIFYADKIDHDVATSESGELLTRIQRVCKRLISLAELRFP